MSHITRTIYCIAACLATAAALPVTAAREESELQIIFDKAQELACSLATDSKESAIGDEIVKLVRAGHLLNLRMSPRFDDVVSKSHPAVEMAHEAAAYRAAQSGDLKKLNTELAAIQSVERRVQVSLIIATAFSRSVPAITREVLADVRPALLEIMDPVLRCAQLRDWIALKMAMDECPSDMGQFLRNEQNPMRCELLMECYVKWKSKTLQQGSDFKVDALSIVDRVTDADEKHECISVVIEGLTRAHESGEALKILDADSLKSDHDLLSIARCAADVGDYSKAVSISNSISETSLRCRALIDISETLRRSGRGRESTLQYGRAAMLADELRKTSAVLAEPDIIDILQLMISVAVQRGDDAAALSWGSSNAIPESQVHFQIAERHLRDDQFDAALTEAERCAGLRPSIIQATASRLAAAGEMERAISLALSLPSENHSLRGHCAASIVQAHLARGDAKTAKHVVERLIGNSTDAALIPWKTRIEIGFVEFLQKEDNWLEAVARINQIESQNARESCAWEFGYAIPHDDEKAIEALSTFDTPKLKLITRVALLSRMADLDVPFSK